MKVRFNPKNGAVHLVCESRLEVREALYAIYPKPIAFLKMKRLGRMWRELEFHKARQGKLFA